MKKFLTYLLLLLLILSMILNLTACRRDVNDTDEEEGEENQADAPIDPDKTQIYIANYYGGLGDTWLKRVARAFESANAETVFEAGKKGVQVHVYNDKTIDGAGLGSVLSNDSGDSTKEGNAIYFTESVSYYELLNAGVIADITDIVTAKTENYDLNGDGTAELISIEDKMDATLREYYQTADGKYYALPFYNGFFAMYYDVDLFDEMDYYFANVTSTTLDGSKNNKSAGPDGVAGTADDGLPATYAQFEILLATMRTDNIYPFIWTAAYADYFQKFMTSFWVDYEGYEQAMLNVTLEGTATDLIEVDASGNITKFPATTITSGKNGNAYLLQKQEGKYYALSFIRSMLANGLNYDPLSVGMGLTHTGAQERFLKSAKIAGKEGAQRIAMLIEGNWWESEATQVFSSMANSYGNKYAKTSRRIAIMPTPKATLDDLGGSVIYDMNRSACFINANTPASQMPVAKAFMQFAHNNQSLSTFNTVTSMPRPYTYTITEEDMNNISYFGLSTYNYVKNAQVVYPRNDENAFYLNNEIYFSAGNDWGWTTIINGQKREGSSLIGYFRTNTFTAEEWFTGLEVYHRGRWEYLTD